MAEDSGRGRRIAEKEAEVELSMKPMSVRELEPDREDVGSAQVLRATGEKWCMSSFRNLHLIVWWKYVSDCSAFTYLMFCIS